MTDNITNCQGRNELGSVVNTAHQGDNIKRPVEEVAGRKLGDINTTKRQERSAKMEGGRIVYRIDGNEVSYEEFFSSR